jgi:hypothetical protein
MRRRGSGKQRAPPGLRIQQAPSVDCGDAQPALAPAAPPQGDYCVTMPLCDFLELVGRSRNAERQPDKLDKRAQPPPRPGGFDLEKQRPPADFVPAAKILAHQLDG